MSLPQWLINLVSSVKYWIDSDCGSHCIFCFGLKLVGIFIVKVRKCMMKKSTMKAVTFQGKEEEDSKVDEIETSAYW